MRFIQVMAMKALAGILGGLFFCANVAFWVACGGAFLWSIYLAYAAKGILAALGMIFFPILGQCVLAFVLWPSDFSTLVVAVIGGKFLLALLGTIITALGESGD